MVKPTTRGAGARDASAKRRCSRHAFARRATPADDWRRSLMRGSSPSAVYLRFPHEGGTVIERFGLPGVRNRSVWPACIQLAFEASSGSPLAIAVDAGPYLPRAAPLLPRSRRVSVDPRFGRVARIVTRSSRDYPPDQLSTDEPSFVRLSSPSADHGRLHRPSCPCVPAVGWSARPTGLSRHALPPAPPRRVRRLRLELRSCDGRDAFRPLRDPSS